jgi:MFS family permease
MFFLSRWSGGLVAIYGARTPLIVGPIIAAAGFLLFAVPSVGTTYWTSFFPAFVVLGVGMAVSVAPLTTVVMSSVEEDRAGTASGINNAVARVAGVLAIAVFGVVMVKAFGHALEELLRGLNLDPGIVQFIQSNLVRLGGLAPPTQDPKTTAAILDAIAHAFVFGFRTIMVLCAALALGSSAVALRLIPSRGAESAQKFGRSA